MEKKSYKIKGMHCASCANIIEGTFKKTDGVTSVEVNYGTEAVKIAFDDKKTNLEALSKKIEPFGYSIVMPSENEPEINQSKKEKLDEIKDQKNKVISAIPLAVISIFIMAWDILSQLKIVSPMNYDTSEFFHHLLPIMASYMLFVVGKPYLLGAYRFFRYGKANMDSLIGIGTITAFFYSFIVI